MTSIQSAEHTAAWLARLARDIEVNLTMVTSLRDHDRAEQLCKSYISELTRACASAAVVQSSISHLSECPVFEDVTPRPGASRED